MGAWFIRRANVVAGGSSPEPPAPSYITDGLIFYLDGINKGSTSGAWTELVSGTVMSGTNVVSTQYGWSFDGTAFFTSSYAPKGSEDYTLEVCFQPSATGTYALFISNDTTTNNLIFFYSGGTITWMQRRNTYTYSISANNPYSISLNLDRGMFNGTEKTKDSGTDYWSGNANLFIVKRYSGNPFSGEIYAIRIYNRRLTAAEQLNNFNVDNGRFNLRI